MIRHRATLQDLALLIVSVLVAAFVLLQVDVFVGPGRGPVDNTIEPDELPLLGIVLTSGLLIFAWRRMRAEKRDGIARLEMQSRLRDLAFQDALTGLPNRRSLMQRLAVAVGSPPAKGATHAVMLLDLNGFKRINDVYGHNAGDQALIIVAQRLLGTVREGDLVARLGGDEFAIVATQLPSSETATGLALRILEKLAEPFVVGKVEDQVSAGIGLCMLPFFCATSDEVLRRADVALYKAKAEGKSALPFFDESMDQQVRERDYLEREFSKALSQGKIRPYFQPLVDLSGNTIVGFEALARWTHGNTRGSTA